ncbi:MAG: transposase [Caldilineaceae bacterium]|nr:transposase [Caldilineaceae bacterium]
MRYSLKYLADAYKRFLADPANEGKPRFKAKHFTVPAFTIPSDVQIRDGRLRVPKVGWLRLAGSNQYAGCKPLTVRMEGTEQHPQWYAYVCYAVPAEQMRQPAADGALGLDRNVGQATDSEGIVYAMSDADKLDARIARMQGWGPKDRRPKSNRGRRANGQLSKLHRKRARKRDNATHQVSRKLAETAHTVVVEDLNTKGMTKSARGTVENPGRQVKQKSGLNRSILANGWGSLERKLVYKAGTLLKVDPAYTSQTCSRCGHVHRDNRPSQAVFACGACGFQANADHNAAINILVRAGLPSAPVSARGTGAAARRGAIPWGTPTTRERGRPGMSVPARAGTEGPAPVPSVNPSV